jgi:hypothetical protein
MLNVSKNGAIAVCLAKILYALFSINSF